MKKTKKSGAKNGTKKTVKKGKAKKAKTTSALVSKSADDFSHAGE